MMIDMIKGKEVLVVGMARSGLAAVKLLSDMKAASIIVADSKPETELAEELTLLSRNPVVTTVTGGNPAGLITANLSLIVKSPGVPPHLPLFTRAAELNIPIISEIELAYTFLRAPLVGVTGTNGKTTTTSLITAMLKESRFNPVVAAGNIGNPLASAVNQVGQGGIIVAELSSFQLENIVHFRPFVSLFLNFSEDHTDYHGSVDAYFRAKARIVENQGPGDYAVLNASDKAIASLADQTRAKALWFDLAPVEEGIGLDGDEIALFTKGRRPTRICDRSEVLLPGEHNLSNAIAAATAAFAAGADLGSIARALKSFKAIEHRLEQVAIIDGVEYINDSKGTNTEATLKALESFPGRPIVLIAGGIDKGGDFRDLAAALAGTVKRLILVGETKEKISFAAKEAGFKEIEMAHTFEGAVFAARQAANAGDLVLLSPACASWDMFKSYEERGDLFKQIVLSFKSAGCSDA